MRTPWDAPADAWIFYHGLNRERLDFKGGTLRDAVIFVLAQTNARGDGYIVRLADKSQQWEGGEIAALGRELRAM